MLAEDDTLRGEVATEDEDPVEIVDECALAENVATEDDDAEDVYALAEEEEEEEDVDIDVEDVEYATGATYVAVSVRVVVVTSSAVVVTVVEYTRTPLLLVEAISVALPKLVCLLCRWPAPLLSAASDTCVHTANTAAASKYHMSLLVSEWVSKNVQTMDRRNETKVRFVPISLYPVVIQVIAVRWVPSTADGVMSIKQAWSLACPGPLWGQFSASSERVW